MTRARKLERLDEVWEWLLEAFPVRRKATLVIRELPKSGKESLHGHIETGKGWVRVTLDPRVPLWFLVETLFHEWAHLKSNTWSDNPHHRRCKEWEHRIEVAYCEWVKTTPPLGRGRSGRS